jgi:hypothetical protein
MNLLNRNFLLCVRSFDWTGMLCEKKPLREMNQSFPPLHTKHTHTHTLQKELQKGCLSKMRKFWTTTTTKTKTKTKTTNSWKMTVIKLTVSLYFYRELCSIMRSNLNRLTNGVSLTFTLTLILILTYVLHFFSFHLRKCLCLIWHVLKDF